MYAIQNIRDGQFVYGTDYRYHPYHQKTSKNQMLTYKDLYMAKLDFNIRKCSANKYRIVKLRPVEVWGTIPLDSSSGYDDTNKESGMEYADNVCGQPGA